LRRRNLRTVCYRNEKSLRKLLKSFLTLRTRGRVNHDRREFRSVVLFPCDEELERHRSQRRRKNDGRDREQADDIGT
jgi:hypothetical protein